MQACLNLFVQNGAHRLSENEMLSGQRINSWWYRNFKLDGFHLLGDLKETYGLSEVHFEEMKKYYNCWKVSHENTKIKKTSGANVEEVRSAGAADVAPAAADVAPAAAGIAPAAAGFAPAVAGIAPAAAAMDTNVVDKTIDEEGQAKLVVVADLTTIAGAAATATKTATVQDSCDAVVGAGSSRAASEGSDVFYDTLDDNHQKKKMKIDRKSSKKSKKKHGHHCHHHHHRRHRHHRRRDEKGIIMEEAEGDDDDLTNDENM